MADNGYKNGGKPGKPTNKDDLFNIVDKKKEPAPAADDKPASKWKMPRLSLPSFSLRDALGKTIRWGGSAVLGLTFLYSSAELDKERPEMSFFSYHGAITTFDRTLSNLGRLGNTVWDYTGRPLGNMLHAVNPVEARRQPLPYAVVCVSQLHEEQMHARDPRAIAYNDEIQADLDKQLHLLATVDAPFYRSNAYFNPDRQAPAAMFRIPAVSSRFNPAAATVFLKPPQAVSEWQIERGSVCRDDETLHKVEIPRMMAPE